MPSPSSTKRSGKNHKKTICDRTLILQHILWIFCHKDLHCRDILDIDNTPFIRQIPSIHSWHVQAPDCFQLGHGLSGIFHQTTTLARHPLHLSKKEVWTWCRWTLSSIADSPEDRVRAEESNQHHHWLCRTERKKTFLPTLKNVKSSCFIDTIVVVSVERPWPCEPWFSKLLPQN